MIRSAVAQRPVAAGDKSDKHGNQTGDRGRLNDMARRIALVLLPLLLVAAACADDDARRVADLDGLQPVAALTPFDSCEALLDHLRAEARQRVGPYGLDGDVGGDVIGLGEQLTVEDDVAADGRLAGAEGLPSPTGEPAPTAPTSGTNTQEAFVDEADIVKVTAERMILVDETVLRIVDLTGQEPEARGTVDLPAWGQEILVVGDRVLAIGPADDVGFREGPAGSTWGPYGPVRSVLTEIDVSDADAPTVVHTLEVESGYLSARLVGETARVVVSATRPAFPFVHPSDGTPQASATAEATNRQVIEDATLDDWLPGATLDGEAVDLLDCADVQRPEEFSGFGFLSVLTVDMTGPLATPPSASVLADGQTVYASGESLYVATSAPAAPEVEEVEEVEEPGEVGPGATGSIAPVPELPPGHDAGYETALHRFDITGTGPATWVASGAVPGHLLNQFALSEHDGRLRVATTEGAPWDQGDRAASRVAVLETDGQELVEVGAVDGLGRTEQIHAVRFVGDTGYVVTFRQTDPLFVIDLSDPTAPTMEGELEIPGYSAYLHPLDDGHLLGIGQDADDRGITRGLQASVFDVTDPTDPTRVDQVVFPGRSSAVEWDHRAFLYWAATGQAVLPLTSAHAIVLSVGPDRVDEQGRVDLPGGQEVLRNVVVGDRLLTVGADTLVTSDLADLTPLAELPL